jgi:dUTP pyrophosphatase
MSITSHPTLHLYVNEIETNLYNLYKNQVEIHNQMIDSSNTPDSGFDLLFPCDNTIPDHCGKLIKLGIKAEMVNTSLINLPFQLYARSSIYKTPLILANNVGIIDSGYRGELMAAFRSFSPNYTIEKNTRLLQICLPSLQPFYVKLKQISEISSSQRGEGGFGSTGI